MRTVLAAAVVLTILPAVVPASQSKDGAFDQEFQRLRRGRTYSAQPGGMSLHVSRSGAGNGVEHHYGLTLPEGYDPARSYPLRMQLHGGVMMRHTNTPPLNAGGVGALAGDEPQIVVVPFAWDASPWWTSDQVRSLRAILDAVKQTVNVDENRVIVSGVSDGGTGAYYVSMRETTPFAAFLPLNGFWGVLANHDLQVDGPLFPNNMRNKPFFIVNGERDPLYPTSIVDPAIAHYRTIGLTLDYRPQAGAGHNTQWWPRVKGEYEAFARAHVRDPLPDRLTWETADARAFNRAHWLLIDALGTAAGEAALDDPNLVEAKPRADFGARSLGNRINQVTPGSNADRIGLKAGDGLVRLNDMPARVRTDIGELFDGMDPGTPITLLVARDNAPLELSGVYQPATVTDPPAPLFDRYMPSGRVDLVRTGNTVEARTHGVTAFTLLLSPDRFDFSKPITVVVNGRVRHDARVARDVAVLRKWAALDNDRTMLFAAELHVTVR